MKLVRMLFLSGFFVLLFLHNVVGQEKSEQEKAKQDSKESNSDFVFVWNIGHRRTKPIVKNTPPVINGLYLDKTELVTKCFSKDQSESGKFDESLLVNVFTDASDVDEDNLEYRYEVSGGKIIGNQEKVVWDLSSVKEGTYTIKVLVNDGCDACNPLQTRDVEVVDGSNCQPTQ